MELDIKKIKRSQADYKGNISVQTGFPSPATHYREPVIDLNEVLTSSKDATFYVRVSGEQWSDFNILDQDVLVIDRALPPSNNALALVIKEGAFEVMRLQHTDLDIELWGLIAYIIHKAV